jgi:hypothetical protein
MKLALNSIGYNRPELHKQSLDTIFRCDEIECVNVYTFIDGSIKPKWIEDYNHQYTVRDSHLGLTKNILLALKQTFGAGYDVVIHVEDDILLSRDFIRFVKYCIKHFKDNGVFSIAGYSRPDYFTETNGENCVTKTEHYSSLAVAYDRNDWRKINPHIKEE